MFLLALAPAYAQSDLTLFNKANDEYTKANYEKAIELYESIFKKDMEAGELYFNLGNAYYKTNQIGMAILNYERAKKLLPNDEDIETNLALANLKTEDKIESTTSLSFTAFFNNIANLASEKAWSLFCIVSFSFSLLLYTLYLISNQIILQKSFFYAASSVLLFSIITFFITQFKYNKIKHSNEAIIISPVTTITAAPASKSTKLFMLHEGTKAIITEEENSFLQLRLSNGNVGWVAKKDIRRI
jgi:tetratricopeptide (TPR) repeat protein